MQTLSSPRLIGGQAAQPDQCLTLFTKDLVNFPQKKKLDFRQASFLNWTLLSAVAEPLHFSCNFQHPLKYLNLAWINVVSRVSTSNVTAVYFAIFLFLFSPLFLLSLLFLLSVRPLRSLSFLPRSPSLWGLSPSLQGHYQSGRVGLESDMKLDRTACFRPEPWEPLRYRTGRSYVYCVFPLELPAATPCPVALPL